MEEKTVLTLTNYGKTVTVEHPDSDVTIEELVEDFVGMLRTITFSDSQIISEFKRYIDEHEIS